MKSALLILFCLTCGCTARDFHLAAVSQSMLGSTQKYHLDALRADAEPAPLSQYARACYYFPEGYGGFSIGCR